MTRQKRRGRVPARLEEHREQLTRARTSSTTGRALLVAGFLVPARPTSKHYFATIDCMKKRAGGTTHLSISLPTEDAKILKRRAKRAYGGNVSRVVSDAIRYIAYEEGRDALIATFGERGKVSTDEAREFDAA